MVSEKEIKETFELLGLTTKKSFEEYSYEKILNLQKTAENQIEVIESTSSKIPE